LSLNGPSTTFHSGLVAKVAPSTDWALRNFQSAVHAAIAAGVPKAAVAQVPGVPAAVSSHATGIGVSWLSWFSSNQVSL
jgi:hypothetical protein